MKRERKRWDRDMERETDREGDEAEIWRLEGESEREKREKTYREK